MESPKENRKSVAFSEGATVVDCDGKLRHESVNGAAKEPTAESHAPNGDTKPSDPTDEVTDLFKGAKKKKSSKPKTDGATSAPPAADAEFDPTQVKKKKKKKAPAEGVDDFEAKLAKLDLEGEGAAETEKVEEPELVGGDFELGTGVWNSKETKPIK